jgi:hypothetical protein
MDSCGLPLPPVGQVSLTSGELMAALPHRPTIVRHLPLTLSTEVCFLPTALSRGSKENPGNIKSNHETLNSIGIKNTAYVSPETAHEFLTWRRRRHEFAPLLFVE